MVRLQYRGKKVGKTLELPQLTAPIRLQKDPIDVCEADAQWLMANNPVMFHNLGTVVPGAPAPEPVPPEAEPNFKPTFVCDKCGKDYKIERFYKAHIAECTGPEDED